MPPPSEAALRYAIIDRCLTNPYKPFPTMDVLKYAIERELKTSVSTATIQKDIAQMKKSVEDGGYGAPIKFRKALNGYYYDLDRFPDYTIQAFGLNEKEIEAIELAAGVLQHFKGIKVNDSYNHAIDKLFSSVNLKKASTERALVNAIQPEETTYMRGMEHFETLVSSIRKKIPVSFIHYSYDNKFFKAIIIHPYLLKESNKRWYLVGYSEEHKEIRYFGMDRIYDPILINKEFIENTKTDLRGLFNNKIGLTAIRGVNNDNEAIDKNPREHPEEITLWVSKEMSNYIKSMPLHASQKVKVYRSRGEIIVELRLVPTLELINLILSYGSNICVMKPNWLRKEVAKELLKAAQKYNQPLL